MSSDHHCSFVGKMNWRKQGSSLHPTVHILSVHQNCSAAASNQIVGWLVGLNGAHFGEDFRLTEGEVILGSGWDADIVLTSPDVSRTHAKIQSTAHLSVVQDCESGSGVYVNGELAADPRALMHGDVVKLGLGEFVFYSISPAGEEHLMSRSLRPAGLQNKKDATLAWLVCLNGDLQGTDFRLVAGSNRIGSAAGLEVSLPDPNIHANHFIIECSPERFYLRKQSADLQIQRAGLPVEAGVLKDGDLIRAGAMTVKMRIFS